MQKVLPGTSAMIRADSFGVRCGSIALCLFLLFLRLPESFTAPELVLSDGPIFLLLAQQEGVSSLFRPQAGYFHVFPRAALLLASWIPAYDAIVFTYAAHFVLVLVLSLILSRDTRLQLKLPICLAVVLLPPRAYWVHGSAINVVWLLALVVPLVLLRKSSRRLPVWEALLFLLAALSTPIILWCLPFFYLRLRQERDIRSRALWYLALGSWLLQCAAFVVSYKSRTQSGSAELDVEAWIQVFFAFTASPFFSAAILTGLALSLALVLSLFYLILLIRSWRNEDYAVFTMLGIALLSLVPPLISFHDSPRELYWHEDRYTYLSAVLILWVLLEELGRGGRMALLSALLLAIAAVNAYDHFAPGTPAMFETSCPEESLLGPLQCEGALRFRWYR